MKKVIFDCDNTMGIDNRDIDDGLALVYLLNNDEVDLKGITCTYGNDSLEKVFKQTTELCRRLHIDVPVLKGNGSLDMLDYVECKFETEESEDYLSNKAARYIVEMVNESPNEISILATGSLQNIYDALKIDNSIADKIREIVVMGGITSDLYFDGKVMKELNFSVCSQAAHCVINEFKNLTILTGNNCLDIEFTHEDLDKIEKIGQVKNKFIYDKIIKWMNEFKEMYNYDSIVLWDVIAAIYLTDKNLFEDNYVDIISTEKDLLNGRLVLGENGKNTNLPVAKNASLINQKLIDTVFK